MKLKLWWVVIGIALFAAQTSFAQNDKTIYLVRHAEKMTGEDKDPHLTDIGLQRAKNIADILKDKSIKGVYTTDYNRTRQTAEPTAKSLGLNAEIYNPRELNKFAERIKSVGHNVLIVGHSNTTPMLSFLLGGDSFGDIDDSDYTRLYQLTVKDNSVETQLIPLPPISKNVIGTVSLKPERVQNQVLKFQMRYKDKVVGESIQKITVQKDQIKLGEKTIIAAMNIDADIAVSVDAKTLAPRKMTMKGSMGTPVDINMQWQAGRVSGYSQIDRSPYQKQGKIQVDEDFSVGKVERSALILLAHQLAVDEGKPYFVQWFDAYTGETRDIQVSYQGEAKVTVPAGSFDTYKLRLLGGAPSQLFYISKGSDAKVVKIEVIAMPWVYELLE